MKVLQKRMVTSFSKSRSPFTLEKLKDKFSEAIIVGSGPTSFDYSELKKFHSLPVFFINQMHQFSHQCPSPFKFFVTHHIAEYCNVAPITLWIQRMYLEQHSYSGFIETSVKPKNPFIKIDCQADEQVVDDGFFKEFPWLLNKNEIIKRNRLLALYGSITTAIHFAWFCGARKIVFIGCNPYSGTVDHDPRIGGKMIYQPGYIHKNTILLPQYLKIEVEHV